MSATAITDFNDLAKHRGMPAVAAAIGHAVRIGGEWPEPLPLPNGLLPVPTFDAELLPDNLRAWSVDAAERMQCPLEYVGIPTIIALGSVIGRKTLIRPQQFTDWSEASNLWGMIIGRPGTAKSPALDAALAPLKHLEANARKAFETDKADHAAAVAEFKLKREAAERDARDKLKESRDHSVRSMLAMTEPEAPVSRRYLVNDTTYEKLGEILAQNPSGVLAVRDELMSLLVSLGTEEASSARGMYLTAWGGKSGYAFDRISRGEKHIEAACLSLFGTTQPARIADFVRASTSGAADDGMIQRFSLMSWPDLSPNWQRVDRYPDSAARRLAFETFETLDTLNPDARGAERDPFENAPPFFRFTEGARREFEDWHGKLEMRLREGGESPALESHLSKFKKLVPAAALINHLAGGGRGPVGERATIQALGLAEYAEAHARRVYAAGALSDVDTAKAILRKIKSGDIPPTFAARDIYRKGWSGMSNRDQVAAALDLLADHDWLGIEHDKETGGRFATRYTINPRGLA